jgi:hypothetical protein
VPGRPADIGIDTRRGHVAVPYIALNRVDVWSLRPRSAPRSATDRAVPKLIGLVELPGLFGTRDPDGPPGALLPAAPAAVPVHAQPRAGSVRLATVSAADSLEWREIDYEAPAAVAYGVAEGWVRVALQEGSGWRFGWVPPEHRGTLHPLGTLLDEGLAYMTSDWDGVLRKAPSRSSAASRLEREGAGDPIDMNVLQVVESDGATWIEVELLAPGRCLVFPAPPAQATGWVPALASNGRPNAWFYSRGC